MNPRIAAAAVITLTLLAATVSALYVRAAVLGLERTAASQAKEAPDVVALYRTRYASLDAALPAIARHLERDGIGIIVYDTSSRKGYDQAGSFDMTIPESTSNRRPFAEPAGFMNRFASFVAVSLGARGYRISAGGTVISVAVKVSAVVAILRQASLAFALVFVPTTLAAFWYVRNVRREALAALAETTASLRCLAAGDFTPRTVLTGDKSPHGELARAYNAAAQTVSAAFAQREAAEREMRRFVADAGHELRTPLAIVIGYVELLNSGGVTNGAVAERVYAGVLEEAARLQRLIDELIELAVMDAVAGDDRGASDERTELVALVRRIGDGLRTLGGDPIVIEAPAECYVRGSQDELVPALLNIMENASKYAPESEVRVCVECHSAEVVVTVTDRGPGMLPEELDNAFKRFYRGERRGEIPGSGLGLAIAKRAVERLGGTITIASTVGAGTTVRLALPAV